MKLFLVAALVGLLAVLLIGVAMAAWSEMRDALDRGDREDELFLAATDDER